MEARALTGYAMLEGSLVIGYSFYVVESGKGLIADAFLHPDYRNGSHEVHLMSHVLETLQATPGLRRIEAQLLSMDGPAVREHFRSLGFRGYDRQFLYLSVRDAEELSFHEDTSLREVEWDSKWFPAAAGLILESYRGHVDSDISDQYQSQSGAVRFLENIIRLRGCGKFMPEASFLVIDGSATERSRLCGMILTTVVSDRIAHITQLCIRPQHQGRGLGRRLIARVVDILRRSGFQGATLSVTISNRTAMELYRNVGFLPLAEFPAFVWDAPARSRGLSPRKVAARS